MRALLALTIGDPCGIGPEVTLKALRARPALATRCLVIGDRAVLSRVTTRRWGAADRHGVHGAGPWLFDLAHPHRFVPGTSSARAGAASLAYLDAAIALVKAGVCRSLVTAPVTKWAVDRAQPGFSGQTEYLARSAKLPPRRVAMAFISDALRVVLLTRHLPLRRVPGAVDAASVEATIRLTAEALRRQFRIARPRFAVCGLNPHAGDAGLFGEEERRVLLPAMRRLRQAGIRCHGPFAADGFFTDPSGYDAVVCWYHDQGLIPFKMAARDAGCQLTLGLPFVRTSPDHGSALDLAGGRGRAHPGSMIYALELAARLSR